MAVTTFMAPEQLRALDRLSAVPGIRGFYLVGGGAIAFHLQHRTSVDVDLFSDDRNVDLEAVHAAIVQTLILDLAAMKLAAIVSRGLRRDFWDLYVIAQAGHDLGAMARAYVGKFGLAESNLYHVMRALTFFEDAERESIGPAELTDDLWQSIKSYFLQHAPALLSYGDE